MMKAANNGAAAFGEVERPDDKVVVVAEGVKTIMQMMMKGMCHIEEKKMRMKSLQGKIDLDIIKEEVMMMRKALEVVILILMMMILRKVIVLLFG